MDPGLDSSSWNEKICAGYENSGVSRSATNIRSKKLVCCTFLCLNIDLVLTLKATICGLNISFSSEAFCEVHGGQAAITFITLFLDCK